MASLLDGWIADSSQGIRMLDALKTKPMDISGSVDLDSEAFSIDPYPTYAFLRKHSPVHYYEPWGMWLITRYADVTAALRRDTEFLTADYPGSASYGRALLQMNGAEHLAFRRLLMPSFRPQIISEFRGKIEKVADELISAFAANGKADLVAQFTNLLPLRIIGEIFGVPIHDRFVHWANAMTLYNGNFTKNEEVRLAGLQAMRDLCEYIAPLLAARRENPGEDLLSYLVHTEIEGDTLGDEEILSFTGLLITAGAETTNHSIGNILVNLLADEAQLAMVKKDPALLTRAFTEALRHSPPVHSLRRETPIDVEIGGQKIAAGQKALVFLGSANRDEQKFENPDRFDIHRANADEHVSFGHSRHHCLGAGLATREIEIAIGLMLDRLPNLRFAAGPIPRIEGARHRYPRALHVEFDAAR